jgi:hypothetical protein|tara:strand:- start:50 stop:448 length:399 start_codon:yes stop_codon:yes gene_type:complete
MATKNVTFDPDAGIPKGVNLTMYGGSDFEVNLVVNTTSNAAFDLTNYSGSAAMSKSVAVGATLGITSSFTVGFTSAYDGKLKVSLGAVNTRATAEGRYVYDVLLKHEVGGGSTVHPLISGNILVVNPVSSAP